VAFSKTNSSRIGPKDVWIVSDFSFWVLRVALGREMLARMTGIGECSISRALAFDGLGSRNARKAVCR
jgi:hypothetical protein